MCKSGAAQARFFASMLVLVGGCSGDSEASKGDSGPDAGRGDGGPGGKGSGGHKSSKPPMRRDAGGPGGSEGSCGLHCFRSNIGPMTSTPFDLKDNPNDHVGLDDDGALVIARDGATGQELIWIANTREGTVSKIDTNALIELGRYIVPGVDMTINPAENGPSRTSVDSEGSVYAGARYGGGISKVSAAGVDCPDTNGDGEITTSSGAGDVLAAGKDDCVIWTTDLGGDARGVAVQEIPTRFDIQQNPDQDPTITEIPGARYVWVGGQENTPKIYKLDAATGEILFTLVPKLPVVVPVKPDDPKPVLDPVPAPTYGLALDGRGNLWISGRNANALGRIDTTRCVDASCNDEPVCVKTCDDMKCSADCDDAVLERIDLTHTTYGITVDCMQRVWLGGAWEAAANGVVRYDPTASADQRLSAARGVAGTQGSGVNGIAADASGWIWGAAGDMGVWRINAETLDFAQVAGTGGPEFSAKGMAVDRRGRVWAIPLRREYAMVITPGLTINDATVEKPIGGLVGPYTYSDMTGEQRRLAANEPGSYGQRFEGCTDATTPTEWRDLRWEADLPPGTFVVFRARTGDTAAEIDAANWFEVAAAPGRVSPIALGPFIAGARQKPGRLLDVQVRMFISEIAADVNGCEAVRSGSPRITGFGVSYVCDIGPQ